MVEEIRISVAMVSYNGEKYIREQIDSIIPQLTEQDELVISDDGSVDGTRRIIEEYQQKDKRIQIVEGPRQGIKKNVECALKHCRGGIIFLADQDDLWKPDKVAKVLKTLEQEKATLVVHDAEVFRENPREIFMESFFAFRRSGAGVVKNMIKNSYIGCCMAFRRELLDKALPIPAKIEMHDQWLGVLNDFYCKKAVFLEEPLLLYRRHGDNSSAMEHYGIGRMISNRVRFAGCFLGRIIHIYLKQRNA